MREIKIPRILVPDIYPGPHHALELAKALPTAEKGRTAVRILSRTRAGFIMDTPLLLVQVDILKSSDIKSSRER